MSIRRKTTRRKRLIPLSRGKPPALDVTVPDTFAESHLKDTTVLAGSAANQEATFKTTKYMSITTTHTFFSIAIETSGAWNNEAIEILQEIGTRGGWNNEAIEVVQEIDKRMTSINSDLNETNNIFQRISIAIQRTNAMSFYFFATRA